MKYKIPQCPTTNHGWNVRIAVAFAKGCGGEIVRPKMTTESPAVNFDAGFPPMENIATYGVLRGTDIAMKASKEFWYIDHGYFDGRENFFRITRGESIHSGEGDHDWDRCNNFYLKLKDWRKGGSNIVLCPPSVPQIEFWQIDDWVDNTVSEIRKYTDRKIVISQKNNAPKGFYPKYKEEFINLSIDQALKDAWVLVTDHSNTMITALTQGIPIICTNRNRSIGSLDKIEQPSYNREWLKNLAYNQWALSQMQSGQAWEELNLWG